MNSVLERPTMPMPHAMKELAGDPAICDWKNDSDHSEPHRMSIPVSFLKMPDSRTPSSRNPTLKSRITGRCEQALDIVNEICEDENDVPEIIALEISDEREHHERSNRSSVEKAKVEKSPTSVMETPVFDDLVMIPLSLDDNESQGCFPENLPSSSVKVTPTSSNLKRQRCKIRFDPMCMIQHTLSRNDMSPEEVTSYWLQPDEFSHMQERDEAIAVLVEDENKATMQQWLEETPCEDNEAVKANHRPQTRKRRICTRGLESFLSLESQRKQSHRLTGLESVLLEQEKQWDSNEEGEPCEYDFEAFRRVYERISKECKIQAEQVARKDRAAVTRMLISKSRSSRRLSIRPGGEQSSMPSDYPALRHRRSSM